MIIPPTVPTGPVFKGKLTKLFKKGQLPEVVYGIYGDVLTKTNVSDEHIIPKSWGGKGLITNIALASKEKNNLRSNLPLSQFLTEENLKQYIAQFDSANIKGLDKRKYVKGLLASIEKALEMEKDPDLMHKLNIKA